MPPSLRNVFAELAREYAPQTRLATATSLVDWADQGVLLLNTALTVREGGSGSHMKMWQGFTTDLMRYLGQELENVVFLLWGAHAQSYRPLIDEKKNKVLIHSHPSPLSRQPFVGCGHFGTCNEWLLSRGRLGIQWL
jgi:uracil-DNA glycosylase